MPFTDSLRWSPANRYLFMLSGLAGVIFIVDQITKQLALSHLSLENHIDIIGDLARLTLVFNEGGAFSTRLGSTYFYSFASIAVMIIVLTVLYRDAGKNRWMDIALALVLGGALGNLTDRLRFGAVVDFLDIDFPNIDIAPGKVLFFDFPGYQLDRWPVFNVADSAVSIGMVLLVISLILDSRKRKCELPARHHSTAA